MPTEQIVLDVPRTEALLRQVVAEVGAEQVTGYITVPGGTVQMAAYVADGQCCCLLAHVLHRAGIELAELIRYNLDAIADLPIDRLHIDAAALTLLTEVQERQDEGEPWGSIVDDLCGPPPVEGAGVVTR